MLATDAVVHQAPLILPFERSGIAARSDLDDPAVCVLLRRLEFLQSRFLEAEPSFRSDSYGWPRDPLHTWSRVWEYPYVLYWLEKWQAAHGRMLQAADIGSGVTFFPFAVSEAGYEVTCWDIDPVVPKDLASATRAFGYSPQTVVGSLTDGKTFDVPNGSYDVAYCISVLEHTSSPEAVVAEISRVLRDSGLFVLTFDLDLRGGAAISPEGYRRLMAAVFEHFESVAAERSPHPLDELSSRNSTFPALNTLRGTLRTFVGKALQRNWRGVGGSRYVVDLSVFGGVYRKRR